MKRDPALIRLSRDHHKALSVALRLRRADEETSDAVRAEFLAYWSEHGQRHFELEEQVLLPAFAAHGDPHHELVARALCDHVAIRHRAGELARDSAPALADLHELGGLLSDHVRLEERRLFPLIEQALPEARLAEVATGLEQGAR